MRSALLHHPHPALDVSSLSAAAFAGHARDSIGFSRFGGWAILALAVAFLAFGLIHRSRIVAMWPQTETIYRTFGVDINLRGVSFRSVTSSIVEDRGQRVLLVEGRVANVSRQARPVWTLNLELRDGSSRTIYQWKVQIGISELKPGAEAPFRARLVAPPAGASAVAVRFIDSGERS
jgi:hypothetical protein